jgi:hypothetical protein
MSNFIQVKDKDIVSVLKKTDEFLGERMFNGQLITMRFRVEFEPFYFKHASHWRIRVFSRSANKLVGLDSTKNLNEYIYINDQNINRFYFPINKVTEYLRQKQLTEFLNNNQPKT